MRRRVLILGGTGDAVDLARLLESRAEFDVVTSLAGRTRRPAATSGRVRTGGFGGVEGLTAYLAAEHVEVVVDATHPYAATISKHATLACDATGVPRIQLWRPAWSPVDGDEWTGVVRLDAAADTVADARLSADGCVFLSTGVRDVHVFGGLREVRFLVRLVEAPRTPLPLSKVELIVDRGPFAFENERALFLEHGVELLVSKNSGGAATYSKLAAARELGVPVVMVDRPDPEPGARAETAEEAFRWLARTG
ncbi:MAG: cobalt-precorrin-6A reductase [Chromatiales bacterium]|nr:cobalt-precorrin-6A reductase [Chromatiales bacterium]